jgi:putative FmdB family regulatory protein
MSSANHARPRNPEETVPTYQYACTTCGHQLEAVQSFADEPLTECPACEGKLRKIFSSVGIVFKGSGFYRTDSRSAPSESSSTEPGSNGSAPKKETTDSGTGSASSSEKSSASSSSGTAGSASGDSSSTSSASKTPSAA